MIDEDLSFPLRVACVDMGSTAIRFLAAEFANEKDYVTLQSERVPIRLGHGVYLSGRLDNDATLYLEGTGGPLLEGWSLKKKSELFGEVFDRKVKLRFVDQNTEKAVS